MMFKILLVLCFLAFILNSSYLVIKVLPFLGVCIIFGAIWWIVSR